MNYRKPTWDEGRTIEAVQWDGFDETADEFMGAGNWRYADTQGFRDVGEISKAVTLAANLESEWRPSIVIRTQAGDARIEPGDYITRGASGKLQPVRCDVFERTYERVD